MEKKTTENDSGGSRLRGIAACHVAPDKKKKRP